MNPLNPHPSDSFLFLLSKGYESIEAEHINWTESNMTVIFLGIFYIQKILETENYVPSFIFRTQRMV